MTANERFKANFDAWTWRALCLAVLVHFGVLGLWPDLQAADLRQALDEVQIMDLPPDVELPTPPDRIVRPATPLISDLAPDDITIPQTTLESNPVEVLAPPTKRGDDVAAAPHYTPFEVRPEIKNLDDVRRALERLYPPRLRDAGIGGSVNVWFYIDETGQVRRSEVHTSSGYPELDAAALRVAELAEFSPALNRDRAVPVWITLDLTFSSR